MKKIYNIVRERIIAEPKLDFGVLILFSAVTFMFIYSLIKFYLI